MKIIFSFLIIFTLILSVSQADERIGAFLIIDDFPDIIIMDGEISINTPLEFRRALNLRPNVKLLLLNSHGGLVASSLIIADDIHNLNLNTIIPHGFKCYSACAFIFLAGDERLAKGELGVHQISSELFDQGEMQYTISDIVEALEKFDTPTAVVTRMFRTPSSEIYVFSSTEIDELNINQLGETILSKSYSMDTYLETIDTIANKANEDNSKKDKPNNTPYYSPASRIALYEGLDFYGADISYNRVSDAVECVSSCVKDNQCIAFTFNANPNLTKGPNCFLKSGSDRLDAYRDALSGFFLSPETQEAPTFRFGAIDTLTDLRSNIDFPGNDIFKIPFASAKSLDSCRRACIENDECSAFSFIKKDTPVLA